jgi:AcrR family transcriptional regulator
VTAPLDLLGGEDVPAEPQQARSASKRARLKAAALAVFGERGYQGAAVSGIARRARLPVGSFYQHFRTKRQLLLVLMNELVSGLSRVEFRPSAGGDRRAALHELLSGAFAQDLHYLGAYRAWQEAVLADPDLAEKERQIRAWTTARVTGLFRMLLTLPGARVDVDEAALGRILDDVFWNLLAEAAARGRGPGEATIDAICHLIEHALFRDS